MSTTHHHFDHRKKGFQIILKAKFVSGVHGYHIKQYIKGTLKKKVPEMDEDTAKIEGA